MCSGYLCSTYFHSLLEIRGVIRIAHHSPDYFGHRKIFKTLLVVSERNEKHTMYPSESETFLCADQKFLKEDDSDTKAELRCIHERPGGQVQKGRWDGFQYLCWYF